MSKEEYKKHIYALILAGGGGTRLWPKSRNKTPKQFLPLFNKKTLTQITVERLNKILPMERIYCVTVSQAYKKEIMREVPRFHPENIIVEPARKDTGPAHGIGALYIYKNDPEAVIITESADRIVKPVSLYLKTLQVAAYVSYTEKVLFTIGVKARFPNIGYGYIKRGKKINTLKGINYYQLERFVEKPPLELATKYVSSGQYYWNAGQFVWRAKDILESLQKNEPKISGLLKKIESALGSKEENSVLIDAYKEMPLISIDYAVAEKEKNFLVAAGEFYWSDIGDWNEVWENLEKDEANNVIIDGPDPGGRVINIDTANAVVHLDGRLVAIVDVDDVAIIDTKDILLVCAKSKAQNVKKIVDQLKAEKKKGFL